MDNVHLSNHLPNTLQPQPFSSAISCSQNFLQDYLPCEVHSRVPLGYLITDGQGPSFQQPSRYPSPPTLHKCHIMCPKYSLGLLSFPGTFWGTPWQLYNWWLTRDFFSVLSKQEQTKFDDLRRRMCQICANIFFCAIGADLQPCTLKNHYFAPHIMGFRAVGYLAQTLHRIIFY